MQKQRYDKSLFLSLLLHLVVLSVLVISFEWSSKPPVFDHASQPEVIQAMVAGAAPPAMPRVVKKMAPPEPPQESKPKEKKPQEAIVKKAVTVIPTKKIQKPDPDKIAEQMLADLKKQKAVQKKEKAAGNC